MYKKVISLTFGTALLLSCGINATACGSDEPETPAGQKPDKTEKPDTDYLDNYSEDNIYSCNVRLTRNAVMQSFSFDTDGSVWYTQVVDEKMHVIRVQPNKSRTPVKSQGNEMVLTYFGHGTNTEVEVCGNDRYIWVGCYGTCNSSGEYGNGLLLGRVKFVDGKTVKTDECDDYFYIGENCKNLHPAIDADNGLLAIYYVDTKRSSYRNIVIYKLSEVLGTPLTDVTMRVTEGFRTGEPAATYYVNVTEKAHDLTRLTPVARLSFAKKAHVPASQTYYDWQGFDVYKDRIYWAEGMSNRVLTGTFESGTPSYAYMTVFDFNGKIAVPRTQVKAISDMQWLSDQGLSHYGSMEAEGVKIRNGKMYLGFTARGRIPGEDIRHQAILVFDKPE